MHTYSHTYTQALLLYCCLPLTRSRAYNIFLFFYARARRAHVCVFGHRYEFTLDADVVRVSIGVGRYVYFRVSNPRSATRSWGFTYSCLLMRRMRVLLHRSSVRQALACVCCSCCALYRMDFPFYYQDKHAPTTVLFAPQT